MAARIVGVFEAERIVAQRQDKKVNNAGKCMFNYKIGIIRMLSCVYIGKSVPGEM